MLLTVCHAVRYTGSEQGRWTFRPQSLAKVTALLFADGMIFHLHTHRHCPWTTTTGTSTRTCYILAPVRIAQFTGTGYGVVRTVWDIHWNICIRYGTVFRARMSDGTWTQTNWSRNRTGQKKEFLLQLETVEFDFNSRQYDYSILWRLIDGVVGRKCKSLLYLPHYSALQRIINWEHIDIWIFISESLSLLKS